MLLDAMMTTGAMTNGDGGLDLDPTAAVLPAWAPAAVPSAPAVGAEPSPKPQAKAEPAAGGRWVACDERAGVVEIRDARMFRRGHEGFCRALVEAAVLRFGAARASVSIERGTCRLEFGPRRLGRAAMARRAASAVRAATRSLGDRPAGRDRNVLSAQRADTPAVPALVDRAEGTSPDQRSRLAHLAIAGGSFAAAVAAVILPGLPTLPFLLMTGRHAALASPRLERWLKRHPWSAALLARAEESTGIGADWRSLVGMVAVAALFAAGIWVFQPPMPIILLLEAGLMAFMALYDWLKAVVVEAGTPAPAIA